MFIRLASRCSGPPKSLVYILALVLKEVSQDPQIVLQLVDAIVFIGQLLRLVNLALVTHLSLQGRQSLLALLSNLNDLLLQDNKVRLLRSMFVEDVSSLGYQRFHSVQVVSSLSELVFELIQHFILWLCTERVRDNRENLLICSSAVRTVYI
jgi:hypothetical protein